MTEADAFIRACAAILRDKLPPDADLLLVERQRVARRCLLACEQWGFVMSAKDLVSAPAQRVQLAELEAKAAADVKRYGDRLLQIQASLTVEEPRLAQ